MWCDYFGRRPHLHRAPLSRTSHEWTHKTAILLNSHRKLFFLCFCENADNKNQFNKRKSEIMGCFGVVAELLSLLLFIGASTLWSKSSSPTLWRATVKDTISSMISQKKCLTSFCSFCSFSSTSATTTTMMMHYSRYKFISTTLLWPMESRILALWRQFGSIFLASSWRKPRMYRNCLLRRKGILWRPNLVVRPMVRRCRPFLGCHYDFAFVF